MGQSVVGPADTNLHDSRRHRRCVGGGAHAVPMSERDERGECPFCGADEVTHVLHETMTETRDDLAYRCGAKVA